MQLSHIQDWLHVLNYVFRSQPDTHFIGTLPPYPTVYAATITDTATATVTDVL